MDAGTGKIHILDDEELKRMEELFNGPKTEARPHDKFLKRMIPLTKNQEQTLRPMTRSARKGHMRNQPCICGSGKKFKKCCWNKMTD